MKVESTSYSLTARLRAGVDRAVDSFIPAHTSQLPAVRLKAELLVKAAGALGILGLALCTLILVFEGWVEGMPIMLSAALLVLSCPVLLRLSRSVTIVGLYAVSLACVAVITVGALRGGFHGGALWFGICVPLMATFLLGPRAGAAFTLIMVAVFVGFHLYSPPFTHDQFMDYRTLYAALGASASSVVIGVLAWEYEAARRAESVRAEEALAALKQRNYEFEIARDDAQAGSAAKSRFLANMSHELRTPLNGLVGMSALLMETQLDSEQRDYASGIQRSASALMHVIHDILDFSKIEAGRLAFERLSFDPWKLIEDTAELNAEPAHRKGLELLCSIAPEMPSRVISDPTRVRQVLMNLVTNAVKFTEAGEVTVEVTCIARAAPNLGLRFEVRDTGVGIAPENLAQLWDPFAQADESTTRQYGGSGLGLAISRQLIEGLGGRFGVSSEPGVGSTFWFELEVEVGRAAPGGELPNISRFQGRRALLVEGHALERQHIGNILTAWGLRCDGAASSAEAANMLAAGRGAYDVVVVDVVQPLEKLLSNAQVTDTPVIALARRLRGSAQQGITFHILKPVRRARLHQVLASALGLGLRSEASAVSDNSARTCSLRILIAEDHPVNREVTSKLLKGLGYEVDLADNGRQALEILDPSVHAAVLMDCHMPAMDGFEATRRIRRAEGAGAAMPIIALTASALAGDRERCLNAGMNDYLSKPVTRDALAEALLRWTHHRTARLGAQELRGKTTSAALDRTVLRQLVDDTDEAFLVHMVNVYLEDTPNRVKKLRLAFEDGAVTDFCGVAHSLKSASAAMGAARLAQLCTQLEAHASAGTLEGLEATVAAAEVEYERVSAQLAALATEDTWAAE